MSLNNPNTNWWDTAKEASKPVFGLFDMTKNDINTLCIKKFNTGNCFVINEAGAYYYGFILSKNSQAQTECRIDFFAPKSTQKHIPRPLFQIVKISDGSIKVSNKGNDRTRRISFQDEEEGRENFWKLIQFLAKFKDVVDLGDFEDKFEIVSKESIIKRLNSKSTDAEKKEEIAEISENVEIPVSDLAAYLEIRGRKETLKEFEKLLNNDEYPGTYRQKYGDNIKGNGNEAIWHHFLKSNQWIFGLSLNLRFIDDFLDEQSIGNPDTTNSGNLKTDLLGYNDYTILIELKTPKTDIFTSVKSSNSRSNTWSFSPEFIEGFSQCLAQKSDWEKISTTKELVKITPDGSRKTLDQGIIRTIDPQSIFIVGNKQREIPNDSDNTNIRIKRDTLERFIRNNRNINIISYDELYKRAYYIVNGKIKK